jgi:ribosomal protein L35AE/L33A
MVGYRAFRNGHGGKKTQGAIADIHGFSGIKQTTYANMHDQQEKDLPQHLSFDLNKNQLSAL